MLRLLFLSIALLVMVSHLVADDHFESKIRPLLSQHCYECHSSKAKTIYGGLRLDSADGLRAGGDSGVVITEKELSTSLLWEVLTYDGDIQMPPDGKLSQVELQHLEHWIMRGAPFPQGGSPTVKGAEQAPTADWSDYWAIRPTQWKQLPTVENKPWSRNRIDRFLQAAWEAQQLRPGAVASRQQLIRRLTYDLTGLPPSPEEVERFVQDKSPEAVTELIDRLLASPLYGEKWARLWLDMARYTDRTASWLFSDGNPHLYRDWVIQAFNQDMPYDEFIHRQLATDLMPDTGLEDLPALGFLSLSPTYWKELKLPCEIINVIVADEWEERVDTVSRTFLGLTIACARCHDHKYDPISSEDYYGLAGVFASCRQVERPMLPEAEYGPVREAKQQVAKLEEKLTAAKKQKPASQTAIDDLQAAIDELKSTANYNTLMVSALSEESLFVERAGETPQDGTRLEYRPGPKNLSLFVRGNPNRPGPEVPRRFPRVLSNSASEFQNGSGRLELAQAITSEATALAARVIVNRIWLAHFGRGIVETPSNFGSQGSKPSHPELLDDLAHRFVENGWSIKRLHREILRSHTWQLTAESTTTATDHDNVFMTRANRRRLSFEAWRDAILACAGELDLAQGGKARDLASANNHRRTIYGEVHRRDMSTTLQIHDFPDPTQHSPRRSSTTTALQGLYALNGELLINQARTMAQRLQHISSGDDARIEHTYQVLFGRHPTQREVEIGLEFLGLPDVAAVDLWTQYVQMLLVSNEFLYLD